MCFYDGPNDFSILWNQLLILWNKDVIIDSNSLKKNFNKYFIKIYSKKIIEEINKILYKFLYTEQNTISLYYNTYQIQKNNEFIEKLLQLKTIFLNL